MADKIPDPSPDCPRCHYWERTAETRAKRLMPNLWPKGIDQQKAADLLTRAFPQRPRR